MPDPTFVDVLYNYAYACRKTGEWKTTYDTLKHLLANKTTYNTTVTSQAVDDAAAQLSEWEKVAALFHTELLALLKESK